MNDDMNAEVTEVPSTPAPTGDALAFGKDSWVYCIYGETSNTGGSRQSA